MKIQSCVSPQNQKQDKDPAFATRKGWGVDERGYIQIYGAYFINDNFKDI